MPKKSNEVEYYFDTAAKQPTAVSAEQYREAYTVSTTYLRRKAAAEGLEGVARERGLADALVLTDFENNFLIGRIKASTNQHQ